MQDRRLDRARSRGFSLMEILVVVAIIGILSLVTVPAFMNYQRRGAVRSALRSFTSDLRSYRQYAITRNARVRIQFVGTREYRAYQSRDNGATWREMRPTGKGTNAEFLPQTMFFSQNSYDDSDNPADTYVDMDFFPDGTTDSGTITLKTDAKNILNQILIEISNTGQLKTTESNAP